MKAGLKKPLFWLHEFHSYSINHRRVPLVAFLIIFSVPGKIDFIDQWLFDRYYSLVVKPISLDNILMRDTLQTVSRSSCKGLPSSGN